MDKQNQEQSQGQQIPLKFTDDLYQGRYANQMMVRHTPEEFVLDFFNFFPGDSQASIVARVVMAPGHLKRMINALQENLKRYENLTGTSIKPSEESKKGWGFDTGLAK
jgi:hypothetical protein